jgi:hypothetical protein
VKIGTVGGKAPTIVNSPVRTREYLTVPEIERLMAAVQAARPSRFGPDEHTLRVLRVCARDRV